LAGIEEKICESPAKRTPLRPLSQSRLSFSPTISGKAQQQQQQESYAQHLSPQLKSHQPKNKQRSPRQLSEAQPKSKSPQIKQKSLPLIPIPKVSSLFSLQEMGERNALYDELVFILEGIQPDQAMLVRKSCAFTLGKMCKREEVTRLIRSRHLFSNIFSAIDLGNTDLDQEFGTIMCSVFYRLFSDKVNCDFVTSEWLLALKPLILSGENKMRVHNNQNPHKETISKVKEILFECDSELEEWITDKTPHVARTILGLKCLANLTGPNSVNQGSAAHVQRSIRTNWDYNARIRSDICSTGLLDCVVNKITSSTRSLLVPLQLQQQQEQKLVLAGWLWELWWSLKVVENSTLKHPSNQNHLLQCSPQLFSSLFHILSFFQKKCTEKNWLVSCPPVIFHCIIGSLNVLTNLSNESEKGVRIIADFSGVDETTPFIQQEGNGLRVILSLIYELFSHGVTGGAERWQIFDTQVISVALLINLVEKNERNRTIVSRIEVGTGNSHVPAIHFLTNLFVDRYSQLDEKDNESAVIRGYIAVLLGCLMIENQTNKVTIQELFPQHDLKILQTIIHQFVEFQMNNNVLPEENIATFVQILRMLDANNNSLEFLVDPDDFNIPSDLFLALPSNKQSKESW